MVTTEAVPETYGESGPDTIITTRHSPSIKATHFCEEKQKICLTGCEYCKNSCTCLSRRSMLARVLRL